MPLQNRVTPTGEIIADPARGTLMGGNRGILHDDAYRRLGSARWQHPHWICCRLRFKGRPARGHGAATLHRAVLPRRSDRARRRPPPVRRMPARGLPALPSGLARRGRRGNRRRSKSIAPSKSTRRPLIRRGICGASASSTKAPSGRSASAASNRVWRRVCGSMRVLPWRPAGYGAPRPRPSATRAVLS